jgi:aminomethyltransferase
MAECYLTMFLNENAGIIDDAIVCNHEQEQLVRMVVNGANKYTVVSHLQQVIQAEKYDVKLEHLEDYGLVAFQGPKSAEVLGQVMQVPDLAEVPFMTQFRAKFQGQDYVVTRSGYTGEDGFEISSTGPNVVAITEALLSNPAVALAGLGARDSLRLEAGLCLHGHDINPTTTPFEATLMWTVHKRKAGDNRLKFIGEEVLAKQQADVKAKTLKIRKRVGFMLNDAGVVREHCKVFDKEGKEVGETTSGSPSPSLKKTIGMTYVDQALTAENTELFAEQRGKRFSLSVKKMPFVPSNYYKRWGL